MATDDLNGSDNRPADPADALADLAGSDDCEISVPDEQDNVDPLSALNAMARSDEAVSDPGDFAAAAETVADDISHEVFVGGDVPLGVFGGTHVTAGDGYHRHHAHMYKKTMIPLLLVVGAMLVVIGLVAAAMVLSATPEQKFYTWYPRMKLLLFVSFPLAAAVLAGAWLFRRDVNKVTETTSR